ncbi:methylmalonyl-CoA mutase small subunit [Prolixibacteraceae bacterium JC049]|nr:methylmalonyl-CoA mutase small subunit [Prolixibacteraceae bacterium JC049]
MAEKDMKLFGEFPPITTEEWDAKVVADLKGKDFERALVWRTNEGFNVRPYYRQDNLEGLDYLNTQPGEFPFVRGNKTDNNDWYIRQDIDVTDYAEANKKALEVLYKGITSLGFVFKTCSPVTKEDLAVLLKDIQLDAVELNFVCPCASCNCADVFAEYAKETGVALENIDASTSVDPIGSFALRGKLDEAQFDAIKTTIRNTAELKKMRSVAVNGRYFSNAGSSIVQELAFSLAMGAEYLTQLTERDMKVDEIAKNIKFNFGVSANYFMEIAKLRAGRMLWAQIVQAYEPLCECSAKMRAHSETCTYNLTVYDAHVNMLRTQTEAMSAALGGSDSITVLPYNKSFESGNDFSERIARNQQIMLKEESHFDKIVDPGAGSYYIENLTSSIADQVWTLFLEIQEKGGFIAALREGFIQNLINEMAAKRDRNIAIRKENVLGVNQFPNFTEAMDKELANEILSAKDCTAEGAEIETIKMYRGAQAFEALRYATDVYAKENKRPVAFMLTIGNLTFRKARAQFACNFFAVAGFEVIDNNGFATIEEGMAAAKEAGASIVVVCSSDDEYAEFVPAAAEKAENEIIVVAGHPACKAELEAKGVENFIHVKSNVLEDLKAYQNKLGI